MGTKRIKYKEYGRLNRKYKGSSGSTDKILGKYVCKIDGARKLWQIDDTENRIRYLLDWKERRDFGADYQKFETIMDWYDFLDTEAQDRIIRIPLDDEMKELKKSCKCQY